MSFRVQPSHTGCNCKTPTQNSLARRFSPLAPPKNAIIQEDSIHNHVELEEILMQERNKFREQKERFEVELDSEKKLRLTLENKLVKLKEQFARREVQISDLQFQENACLNDNQSLSIENERLRNQLMLLQDISRSKLLDLQTKLGFEIKNGEQAAARYDSEFDKFKKQGLEYIENLTQQYEKKIKVLDERVKIAEGAKRGLTAEIKRLNELSLSNQLNFDTQLRQTINRMRDDDGRKTQQLTKSHEQRFRAIEEAKQALGRKVQQLAKALQQKDKALEDLVNQKFEQTHRLNQELSDANNQKQQIASAYEKIKIDFTERSKPATVTTQQTNSSDSVFLKQQLENKRRQVDGLKDIVRELKQNVKQSESNNGREKQQWVDKAGFYQNQTKKYRELYERLCEKLKLKINQTINTACYTRQ